MKTKQNSLAFILANVNNNNNKNNVVLCLSHILMFCNGLISGRKYQRGAVAVGGACEHLT